ncbi:MAG: hypothetical protein IT442_16205 [Phycisphaeraceae bacterium]|nr:hypothetical protein [Phycisphaeraceae bacterium]
MGRGVLLAAWLGVVIAVPAWATVMYDIQRLDVPAEIGRLTRVQDMDINDSGKVIASVHGIETAFALVWNSGPLTPQIALGRGAGVHMAVALNNVGQGVIGTYYLGDNALMWSAEGSYALGPLTEGGSAWSINPINVGIWTPYFLASDINDLGAIVGGVETPEWTGSPYWSGPMYRPVLIDDEAHFHVLASERERQAIATTINNHGQIAGLARVVEENIPWQYGLASWVIWPSLDQMTSPSSSYGFASDINNRGQIAGIVIDADSDPVVLESDGTMRVIKLQNPDSGIANGQNESGVVVGKYQFIPWTDWGGADRAFVDRPDTGTQLLEELIDPALGWDFLCEAFAVNESGQIVGVGEYEGELSLFLATPIPEPGVCLAGVFAGAWWLGRRQRAMEA